MLGATAGTELAGAQQSAERNRAWPYAFMRKLLRSVPEASVMLLITLLVAGTFMLAGSFSIIAALAD